MVITFGKGKGDDGDGEMLRRNNAKCSVSLKEVIKVESTEHKCVSVSVCVNSTGGWKAESAGREWKDEEEVEEGKKTSQSSLQRQFGGSASETVCSWRQAERNWTELNWREQTACSMAKSRRVSERVRGQETRAPQCPQRKEREKVGKAVTV